MVDHAKVRRESMRWNLINTLDKARPHTSSEQFLLQVMQAIYPDATALEVRRELDYLADRDLVELNKQPSGTWFADLTRYGVDIAEYTIECDPGIARPVKYWAG
jgi:Fe2+ or Zn2+ uptake regulation protein